MARLVLVHGAFGGAWYWEPVVAPLEAAGHTVETFDLPGLGDDPAPIEEATLDAYTERVCEVLRSKDEPAVLVGHSMGGVVVTQAAARCPERISKLIYVAAFLPRDGQSLESLTQLPEGADDQVQANIVVEGEPPAGTLPSDKAPTILFGCCSEEQSAAAVARLAPQPVVPFVTPVALGDVDVDGMPRDYVMCLQDQAIPLALQRRMSTETPCSQVLEIDTDHSPQISATDELAGILDRLATT
jgi:pimeloyl-ACP methyl ester carboxylesterase